MMLGLIGSDVQIDAIVEENSQVVGVENDIVMHEGPCSVLAIPKHPDQQPPTEEEVNEPLYVPPSDPNDPTVPVDPCVDTDPAEAPAGPASLSNISETILRPSCIFSSCHGATQPAAGLNFEAPQLHSHLLAHNVVADTPMALVAPGAPDQSWLLQLLSRCEPQNSQGNPVSHMPLNSPKLLAPGQVNQVRAWIEAGAPNN